MLTIGSGGISLLLTGTGEEGDKLEEYGETLHKSTSSNSIVYLLDLLVLGK